MNKSMKERLKAAVFIGGITYILAWLTEPREQKR